MKERFIGNGIVYVKNGDYYIPNLTIPDDIVYNIGKYGRMHERFIKENKPCFYSIKMLTGTWLAYIEEIYTSTKEMVDKLIKELIIKLYGNIGICICDLLFTQTILKSQNYNCSRN